MKKVLSNQELKGTSDWLPEEFLKRKYIFDTWRKVCLRYGFEEYLTPIFESADIYRAKSGEDIGGKELLVFRDLGDRELAIRPEMTPSVVRMVSKIYKSSPKPIKLFSIANFFRNEKPQRGRNREFWQLNCDIFGADNLSADIEIMKLALDIVLEFDPPENSFVLKINNRKLLDAFLDYLSLSSEIKNKCLRLLDKKDKISKDDFSKALADLGLDEEKISKIELFMKGEGSENWSTLIDGNKNLEEAYFEIKLVLDKLAQAGYADFIEFDPAIIRGFDYYNGLVFEVFDKHPENNRAIFGGGRYNGLGEIFGENNFSALGFAPGDETTKLFLESWGLLKNIETNNNLYYLPLLSEKLNTLNDQIAKKLRLSGKDVLTGLEEQKLGKALEFANKKNISKVVIIGEEEEAKGIYKIKDMNSGQEEEFSF